MTNQLQKDTSRTNKFTYFIFPPLRLQKEKKANVQLDSGE